MMCTSMSTAHLLDSFPMFGHPGISALEYAGYMGVLSMSTSRTSDTFEYRSTMTQDENSLPTTAGQEPTSQSPPLDLVVGDLNYHQQRKCTFLNHTPRNLEMRPSGLVEVYQPSRAPSRGSIENYSRPRMSYHSISPELDGGSIESYAHGHQSRPGTAGRTPIFDDSALFELGPSEGDIFKPGTCDPAARSHRRSISVPVTLNEARVRNVRSSSMPTREPPKKKRQRPLTPCKLVAPTLTDGSRHTSLEALVLEHQRKASIEAAFEQLPKLSIERLEGTGTYLEIRDDGSSAKAYESANLIGLEPQLLTSPDRLNDHSLVESIAIYPIDERDSFDEPPIIPKRSPQRLTNPSFPIHTETIMSKDSDLTFVNQDQQSLSEKADDLDTLRIAKRRIAKRQDVEQTDMAGSSYIGKMAPTILSHAALTAIGRLDKRGLNYDLNYDLRNTGPSSEPQSNKKADRKRMTRRIFSVKQKKSLAARVGSVEGFPQKAVEKPYVPELAREKITSGGIRYFEIVRPSDNPATSQATLVPGTSCPSKNRPRHLSLAFTEEMLNPLASPNVERVIAGFQQSQRRATEPMPPKSPRSPKKVPKSPRRVPTNDHPLLTREESTRARKLRDLKRVKRKPLPSESKIDQQRVTSMSGPAIDLPTPAQTPEPIETPKRVRNDSTVPNEDVKSDDGREDQLSPVEEQVMTLQKQNTELTEALAKIVGLELDVDGLRPEDVLTVFRQQADRILEERIGGRYLGGDESP